MTQVLFLLVSRALFCAIEVPPQVEVSVENPEEFRQQLGIGAAFDRVVVEKVRVAILGEGVKGLLDAYGQPDTQLISRYLPPQTQIQVEHIDCEGCLAMNADSEHERHMAQIIWAVTGYALPGPLMKIINAAGVSSFLAAVREAIYHFKAHIILHAANWETYGDFAGGGEIDRAVKEAVDHGVIWVNAAGNDGGRVHNGKVKAKGSWLVMQRAVTPASDGLPYETEEVDGRDGKRYLVRKIPKSEQVGNTTGVYVAYQESNQWKYFSGYAETDRQRGTKHGSVAGGESHYLRLLNRVDENEITITLSWDGYSSNNLRLGTEKDLDLYLFTEGKTSSEDTALAKSARKQVLADPGVNESLHAEETIQISLPASEQPYLLGVKIRDPDKFTGNDERFRITIRSKHANRNQPGAQRRIAALTFLDATVGEEIGVPGDGVGITVGDLTTDSSRGPTRNGRTKPEIVMVQNRVNFSNGDAFYGSSYSAALFTGMAVLLKAADLSLTQGDLLKHRVPLSIELLVGSGWDYLGSQLDEEHTALTNFLSVAGGTAYRKQKNLRGASQVGVLADSQWASQFLRDQKIPDSVIQAKSQYEWYLMVKTDRPKKEITDYVPGPERWVREMQTRYRTIPGHFVQDPPRLTTEAIDVPEKTVSTGRMEPKLVQRGTSVPLPGLYLDALGRPSQLTLSTPDLYQYVPETRTIPATTVTRQVMKRPEPRWVPAEEVPYEVAVNVKRPGDPVAVKKWVDGDPVHQVELGYLSRSSDQTLAEAFSFRKGTGHFVELHWLEVPEVKGSSVDRVWQMPFSPR